MAEDLAPGCGGSLGRSFTPVVEQRRKSGNGEIKPGEVKTQMSMGRRLVEVLCCAVLGNEVPSRSAGIPM